MKKILLSLILLIFTVSLGVTSVEAKRFGGGKSFGATRQIHKTPPPQHTANPAAATSKPATGSRWFGPLAGLAIGGLLATLFMGHGVASGLLLWILIIGVIFIIWRLISAKIHSSQAMKSANFQANNTGKFSSHNSFTVPASHLNEKDNIGSQQTFDRDNFLRQTKTLFIRLQSDYDNKNLLDIREFTTPQIFAEIQMQIQERGDATNVTEVINIDAQLVDLTLNSKPEKASVVFRGLIREEQGAEPIEINEIWHFEKNIYNTNWLVAGIQQLS